jgi:hypothetical protein
MSAVIDVVKLLLGAANSLYPIRSSDRYCGMSFENSQCSISYTVRDENILFMGTEKYPDEKSYIEFEMQFGRGKPSVYDRVISYTDGTADDTWWVSTDSEDVRVHVNEKKLAMLELPVSEEVMFQQSTLYDTTNLERYIEMYDILKADNNFGEMKIHVIYYGTAKCLSIENIQNFIEYIEDGRKGKPK